MQNRHEFGEVMVYRKTRTVFTLIPTKPADYYQDAANVSDQART